MTINKRFTPSKPRRDLSYSMVISYNSLVNVYKEVIKIYKNKILTSIVEAKRFAFISHPGSFCRGFLTHMYTIYIYIYEKLKRVRCYS